MRQNPIKNFVLNYKWRIVNYNLFLHKHHNLTNVFLNLIYLISLNHRFYLYIKKNQNFLENQNILLI